MPLNWERYDIGFCKEDLYHDDGGNYILYDPDDEGSLVNTDYYGAFSGDEEGCYRVGDEDLVRKEYIRLKPQSAVHSMIKLFNSCLRRININLVVFFMINHMINIFMKEIITSPSGLFLFRSKR